VNNPPDGDKEAIPMINNTTARSDKQMRFSFNEKLIADFNGGDISSDGGLALLREFDQKVSFVKTINKRINDPRNPLFILHEQEELLRQRIFQVALGYEDADDADRLRHDPFFQLTVKNEKRQVLFQIDELASQPTISRLENRITENEIPQLNDVLLDNYIKSREQEPSEIILDLDSTNDPTHGQQQMSMFHGYYEQTMYHPLLITEIKSQMLLGAYLRPGNVHTADNVLTHLGPVIKQLKSAFPKTKIVLREDSGFSSPKMYDFCKAENLSFIIGMATNNVLKKKIAPQLKRARKMFKNNEEKQTVKLYTSIRYKAKSWKRSERIIVKIEINEHSEDVRFVATNLPGRAKDLYAYYTERGECENRIEELKNGFKADRLSCHSFIANYFRLLLHSFAYNLVVLLRNSLNCPALAGAKIDTLRLKLFKVGVWINKTTRKIWAHFSSAWPFSNFFLEAYHSIAKSPHYSLA
jgi:hypothetical protein